jgi:hypothetical protein
VSELGRAMRDAIDGIAESEPTAFWRNTPILCECDSFDCHATLPAGAAAVWQRLLGDPVALVLPEHVHGEEVLERHDGFVVVKDGLTHA